MRCVRFPDTMGEVYGIPESMELMVLERGIILRPCAGVRSGWSEKYALMHERGEDAPVLHA